MEQPFLSNLGVTVLEQARPPTSNTFPPAFEQQNHHDWDAAVIQLIPSGNALEDWAITIKRYVELCTARNVFPFQTLQQNRNDQITEFFRTRRRAFVKFIDRCNFFDNVTIRSTHHKVIVTDRGFILTIYAKARISDPSFVKWLTEIPYPRFDIVKDQQGRHIRQIMDGLDMFVINEAGNLPERWDVGYDIMCPFYPDIPNDHTPSKAEMERFILDILWMPILRSARPLHMNYRLL